MSSSSSKSAKIRDSLCSKFGKMTVFIAKQKHSVRSADKLSRAQSEPCMAWPAFASVCLHGQVPKICSIHYLQSIISLEFCSIIRDTNTDKDVTVVFKEIPERFRDFRCVDELENQAVICNAELQCCDNVSDSSISIGTPFDVKTNYNFASTFAVMLLHFVYPDINHAWHVGYHSLDNMVMEFYFIEAAAVAEQAFLYCHVDISRWKGKLAVHQKKKGHVLYKAVMQ
nr:hypothetical protein L484_001678 [Ipomoea batatas]